MSPSHGNKAHVGFREEAADALERASMISSTPASKDTHALLKVCVAAEALVRLTVTPAEVEYRFAPMLGTQIGKCRPTEAAKACPAPRPA